jgi:hypothetical protein
MAAALRMGSVSGQEITTTGPSSGDVRAPVADVKGLFEVNRDRVAG